MISLKGKHKIFRDSVHGYISVPEEYCTLLIDTPIFQRLRHIEQTSMRTLYPSAHHDRFAHSLGTFYLGNLTFDSFRKNAGKKSDTYKFLQGVESEQWDLWRHAFLIACLLHDCAHAPFSHTFEKYYDHSKMSGTSEGLEAQLAGLVGLKEDMDALPTGSEHEKVSAIIVVTKFAEAIKQIDKEIDITLIARMITGWRYGNIDSDKKKIEYCLISLMNGQAIDVDKLDYIVRDTWASGVNNVSIDIHRLLNAVTIGLFNDKYHPAFDKSALSVLQSVVDARNYLYKWIYSHHKVCYDSWLLVKAMESLGQMYGMNKDDFIKKFFSIESFNEPIEIGGDKFYLPSDSDLISLIKRKAAENSGSEAYEWISRSHKRKALWKSHAEYVIQFPDRSNESPSTTPRIFNQLSKIIAAWEKSKGVAVSPVIEETSVKMAVINHDSLYVDFSGKTVPFTVYSQTPHLIAHSIGPFPYVFIDKSKMDHADDLISFIKKSL